MKERRETAKVREENTKEVHFEKMSYFKDNPFTLNLFTQFYFERAKCFDFHLSLIS